MENKKIGIITFHWANNFGAVLQSYALTRFINEKIDGCNAEIIDYVPEKLDLISCIKTILKQGCSYLIKKKNLHYFVKKNIVLSNDNYQLDNLMNTNLKYNLVISGSDQIWNPFFLLNGNKGKENRTYFNNFFVKKKISYASSFGLSSLPPESLPIIKEELTKFNSISVREDAGKEILNNLGFESFVVCDPTLLFKASDYNPFIKIYKHKNDYSVYLLHKENKDFYRYLKNNCPHCRVKDINKDVTVEKWLSDIFNSKLLITNSFHGVIFSLLFHRPFVVLQTKTNDMNSRFNTLLKRLDLTNRIIKNYDEIRKLLNEEIDWQIVDSKISVFRNESIDYLLRSLDE